MEAAYVHTLRFNLDTVPADWLPQGETYRSRLYEVDEDISNIMTSERNIYGGGLGQQQYRAMDRILQAGHYVIPLFHQKTDRVALWDKFGRPDRTPLYGFRLETWWAKSTKLK